MADRNRVAGYAGIGFFVLLALQLFVAPKPPGFEASGAEIRKYMIENLGGMLTQGFLQILASIFFVVFLVGLLHVLRQAKDGTTLAAVALIGGVLTGATVLGAQAAANAPVWIDGAAQGMGDDVIRLAWSISYLLFGAGAGSIALLAGSTAIGGFRSKVLPATVTWVAALVSVVSLAGITMQFGAKLGGFGLATFGGIALFALVTSLAMATGKTTAVGT